MKKFLEGLKDILYDSTDYVIMIAIVGMVVIVIGWRLDLLFAKDARDIPPKDNIIVEGDKDDSNQDNVTPPEKEPKSESPATETITVNIPAGSLPSSIASILESSGLIPSKADFVQKSQEMKLDTKLKSGTFDIESNSPIEDIIVLLTK